MSSESKRFQRLRRDRRHLVPAERGNGGIPDPRYWCVTVTRRGTLTIKRYRLKNSTEVEVDLGAVWSLATVETFDRSKSLRVARGILARNTE